jgi:hypothetical protein
LPVPTQPGVTEAFAKNLLYRRTAPPAEVIADLQAVDESLPFRKKQVEEDTSSAILLIILVGGVGFGMRSASGANGVTTQTYDLLLRTGRRRELVMTLLSRLRTDQDPKGLVDVTLDQNTGIYPSPLVREAKQGAWDRSDFKFPWPPLQARLQDGTHLSLSAVEYAQKMSKSKLTARGKRKYKYRTRDFTVFQVALRVKPETHPELASLEEAARRAVRLPPDMELTRLRGAEDRLEMHVRVQAGTLDMKGRSDFFAPAEKPPMPEASRVVTMMLLSLYQTLGYARRQHPQSKGTQAV